jgi:hypothetical protein
MSLLGRVVTGESTVIAFDTAFNAVALLFVVAAPVLVATKIGLSRYAKSRASQAPGTVVLHPRLQVEQELNVTSTTIYPPREAQLAVLCPLHAGSMSFPQGPGTIARAHPLPHVTGIKNYHAQ